MRVGENSKKLWKHSTAMVVFLRLLFSFHIALIVNVSFML